MADPLKAPLFISDQMYYEFEGEKTDTEDLVDLAGYISPEDQLLMFQKAGKNLTAWAVKVREEGFDYGSDDPEEDEQFDPTREANYDLVDAALDYRATAEALKASKSDKAEKAPGDVEALGSGENTISPSETSPEPTTTQPEPKKSTPSAPPNI